MRLDEAVYVCVCVCGHEDGGDRTTDSRTGGLDLVEKGRPEGILGD
jgi:hypothetical protein